MSLDLLGYVIEFSIGLAGFSGVIAVFAGRSRDRIQLELFRLRNLLFCSLIPAVLCFVALGLQRSMADAVLAWKLSLTLSVLLLGGFLVHALRSRAAMPVDQKQQLRPLGFSVAAAAVILLIALQALTVAGIVAMDHFDAFYAGLIVTLLVAMYQFMRAVMDSVTQYEVGGEVASRDDRDET